MAFGKKIAREDVWLFCGVLTLNLLTAWLVAGLGGHVAPEALIRRRIGEELLNGMTVGRQGLVCSVWFAPVPTLLLLPFLIVPWDALHVVAPHLISAAFGAVSVMYLNKILRDFSLGYSRFILALFFVLNPMTLLHAADGSSLMIFVGLMLAVLHYLLRWIETNGLRDLSLLSLLTATASLTHQMGVCLAGVVVVVVLFHLARKPFPKTEREGKFLLCAFPVFYAAALWLLFNWLIMHDGLFFLRGTYLQSSGAGGGLLQGILAALKLSPVFIVVFALLIVIAAMRRDFNGWTLILVAGIVLVFHGATSRFVNATSSPFFAGKEALGALIPLTCLFIGRLAQDTMRWRPDWKTIVEGVVAVGVAAAIFYNAGWNTSFAGEVSQLRGSIRREEALVNIAPPLEEQLKQHVMERSQRGRKFGSVKVFVSGFKGFLDFAPSRPPSGDQLGGGIVFVQTLDFDLQSAMQDYYKQDLFVLVPKPTGLSAFESVHRKYQGIFDGHNDAHFFYDSDWGDWRLFEILKTTEEDLKH